MSECELGGVGEGLWVIDSAHPLTQLQLGNKLPSLHNPLPLERDMILTKGICSAIVPTRSLTSPASARASISAFAKVTKGDKNRAEHVHLCHLWMFFKPYHADRAELC
jgi:hypothetical protein